MAEDMFTTFLRQRGHDESENKNWKKSGQKLQCPECGGINDTKSKECTSCGWEPEKPKDSIDI